MAHTFPFSAIVGQDEMKLAILIAAVDPSVGGVLVFGDRGTGTRWVFGDLPPFNVGHSPHAAGEAGSQP